MRNISLLLMFIVTPLTLTGCWDKTEVEEQSYVTAIGIDIPEGVDLNKTQAMNITFQLSNPKLNVKGASSSPSEEQKDIITITVKDFIASKKVANSVIARKVSFVHNQTIIVSEDLARSEFFSDVIASLIRERELRRRTSIIVTKGKASDFIKSVKPELQIRPHKYYKFMINRAVDTGLIPEASISRYLSITNAGPNLFAAIYAAKGEQKDKFVVGENYTAGKIPRKGGNEVELAGSAIFKKGKMVGVLSGIETRQLRFLDNTSIIEDLYILQSDPLHKGKFITIRVNKLRKNKIEIEKRDNKPPKVKIKVPMEVEVLSIFSREDYVTKTNKQKLLKRHLENEISTLLTDLIKKMQKEYKGDPFNWSLEARTLFYTNEEYENWNWSEKQFPEAEIDLKLELQITGFGRTLTRNKEDINLETKGTPK